MQRRVRFHSRRADVFLRQGLQERAQAVQKLQSKSRAGQQRIKFDERPARRDQNRLLAMWQRNDSSLQTHPGSSRLLPRVLPAAARDGHFPGGRIGLAASSRSDAGTEANQSVTLQGQGGPSRDSGHPGFFLRTVANHRDQSYNFAPYHSAVILSAAKDLSVYSYRAAIIEQPSRTAPTGLRTRVTEPSADIAA